MTADVVPVTLTQSTSLLRKENKEHVIDVNFGGIVGQESSNEPFSPRQFLFNKEKKTLKDRVGKCCLGCMCVGIIALAGFLAYQVFS